MKIKTKSVEVNIGLWEKLPDHIQQRLKIIHNYNRNTINNINTLKKEIKQWRKQ